MPRTGRPSKIDQVIANTETGPVTVSDRIVQALRAGNYLEPAAAHVGIGKDAVYDWLKIGNAARKAITDGANRASLSAHQRKCLDFADAVAEATAQWEVEANARLEQLGRGGAVKVIETVKVGADGNEIERTTRTEVLEPNANVLTWRLKHRFPDRYRERVEHTGPEGEPIPIEVRVRALADSARAARGELPAGDAVPAP